MQGNIIAAEQWNSRVRVISHAEPHRVHAGGHWREGPEWRFQLRTCTVATSSSWTETTAASVTSAQMGFQDGDAQSARFNHPNGVTMDGQGNTIVATTHSITASV